MKFQWLFFLVSLLYVILYVKGMEQPIILLKSKNYITAVDGLLNYNSDEYSQMAEETINQNSMITFACRECPAQFPVQNMLILHHYIHLKPYKCALCFRRYKLEGSLTRHIKDNHSSDEESNFTIRHH